MAFRSEGTFDFVSSWDAEGQRTYSVTYLLTTLTPELDGPQQAMVCPDLPRIGSTYAYGNEIDIWAWRQPGVVIKAPGEYQQGQLRGILHATVTFATRARTQSQDRPNSSGGGTDEIQDPLAEPPRISIGFSKFTEEASKDRFGKDITNSAFESIHGALNEWDSGRPTVTIEQNVAQHNLPQLAGMVDTVNSRRLWGNTERSVKLSSFQLQKKYGRNNSYYWTRTLNFEINLILDTLTRTETVTFQAGASSTTITFPSDVYPQAGDVGRIVTGSGVPAGTTVISVDQSSHTMVLSNPVGGGPPPVVVTITISSGDGHYIPGWDRDLIDEGTKALDGKWVQNVSGKGSRWVLKGNLTAADRTNPAWYVRATDPHGNISKVVLNGRGVPFDESDGVGLLPGNVHIEKYPQSNFLILGIPDTL